MTTKDTIQHYFQSLERKNAWDAYLAEDMTFASFTTPIKQAAGRGPYLEATKRFFSMITAVETKQLIVDGSKACALTHYKLQAPGGGAPFDSHVAEIFEVRDGKITSLEIYFDSAPFPKRPAAA